MQRKKKKNGYGWPTKKKKIWIYSYCNLKISKRKNIKTFAILYYNIIILYINWLLSTIYEH